MRNTYLFLLILGAVIVGALSCVLIFLGNPSTQRLMNADKELIEQSRILSYATQSYLDTNHVLPKDLQTLRADPTINYSQQIRGKTYDNFTIEIANQTTIHICTKTQTPFAQLEKNGLIQTNLNEWIMKNDLLCRVNTYTENNIKPMKVAITSTPYATPTLDPKSCGLDSYSLSPSGQVIPKSSELSEITQVADFHKYPRTPSDTATSNKVYFRCKTDTSLSSKNLYRQAFAGVDALISEAKWQERLEYFCQIPCLGNKTANNTCKASTTQSQCDSAPSIASDCGWYACSNSCELKWTPTEFICRSN